MTIQLPQVLIRLTVVLNCEKSLKNIYITKTISSVLVCKKNYSIFNQKIGSDLFTLLEN